MVQTDTSRYTWRTLPFLISGLTLYPIIVGFIAIPVDKPHTVKRKIDWLGAITITCSQLLLCLALTFPLTDRRG
jgi:hypothetical protein